MKIPCSVALVLAASSPQGGTGFTTSTAALRNVKGASAGNMRMAGDTAYVCNGLVYTRVEFLAHSPSLPLSLPPSLRHSLTCWDSCLIAVPQLARGAEMWINCNRCTIA